MADQRLTRVARTMQVRSNPKHAEDHNGEPMAAVPWPTDVTRYVGATVNMARSNAERRIVFDFSEEPETVPTQGQVGHYFVRKLREGELLPACDTSKKYAKKAGG